MENNRAEIVEARCLGVHFFFLSFSFNNLSFFHLACRKNFRVAKIFLPEKLAIFFFLVIFLSSEVWPGRYPDRITTDDPRSWRLFFFFFFSLWLFIYIWINSNKKKNKGGKIIHLFLILFCTEINLQNTSIDTHLKSSQIKSENPPFPNNWGDVAMNREAEFDSKTKTKHTHSHLVLSLFLLQLP